MSGSFDPCDWLQRFTEAGGWYAAQGASVHTGWSLDNLDQAATARAVWAEIEHRPERRDAVRCFVTTT